MKSDLLTPSRKHTGSIYMEYVCIGPSQAYSDGALGREVAKINQVFKSPEKFTLTYCVTV